MRKIPWFCILSIVLSGFSVRDVTVKGKRTGNSYITLTSSEFIEVKCYAEVVVNMLEG